MNTESIKTFIENLLQSMNISFDAVEVVEDPETLKKVFVIKTKEQSLLIGENGETFYAFAHIIRRAANKNLEEHNDISIEVGDYQKNIIEALKTEAVILANKVKDTKTDIEMEPTSSYKRLIVHEALKGIPNIKTESMGDGRERRVIIKYVG